MDSMVSERNWRAPTQDRPARPAGSRSDRGWLRPGPTARPPTLCVPDGRTLTSGRRCRGKGGMKRDAYDNAKKGPQQSKHLGPG